MTSASPTIAQLLQHTEIDKFDAQFIVQHTLKLSRASIIAHPDKIITASDADIVKFRLERRAAGEPVAYILGEREFYGEVFKVNPAVLIPRPETEHLVEAVLTRLSNAKTTKPMSLLDLGTGSGAIAVTLARLRPEIKVTATDVSADALRVARENAHNLNTQVEFYQGSWYAALPTHTQKFDIVVSNPPYIADGDAHLTQGDLRFEPPIALSDQTPNAQGFAALQHIIDGAPSWLVDGGWLLFEHGYDQAQMAQAALIKRGFSQVFTQKDLGGCDRVSGGAWGSSNANA
jgi:release factor glutamine methyltransferase